METPAAAVPLSIHLTLLVPALSGQALIAMVEAGIASFEAGPTVDLETAAAARASIRRAP